MDKYTKMCKEAKRLQLEWKPRRDDIVAYKYVLDGHIIEKVDYFFRIADTWKERENFKDFHIFIIWRQNQLQKILLDRDIKYVKSQIRFYRLLNNFCYNANPNWNRNDYYMTFESFEQIWLALVMKEKFGEQWDNKKEKWIKQ